jgi:hypothetical protein
LAVKNKKEEQSMRRIGISTTAAMTLMLGVTAAGAQAGSDPRRADDQGQTSQVPAQTLNLPSQQRDRTQGQSEQPPNGPRDQDAQAERQGQNKDQQQPPERGAQAPAQQAEQTRPQGEYAGDRDGAEVSDRVSLNKEQRSSINSVIRQRNIEPVTTRNFSLAPGTRVPASVPLVPVPDTIVAVLPQYLNHAFFVDEQQELVMVDPSTRVIKARVPISSGAPIAVGSRTDREHAGAGARSSDTERAGGAARSTDTERVGASSRADAERSIGSSASASAPHPSKRIARETGPSDESAGDVPRKKLTQTDRQRSTAQNGAERRKTVQAETDVTVGSSAPETVEIQEPVSRRVFPPVRQYRRVDREGGPVPTGPVDRGIFGIFDIFR